jgi:hypothetical protein
MVTQPKRRPIPLHVKLDVALRALGLKESEIDWSHEPALGLRAIRDDGSDYEPRQHDPDFIFIRKSADHDHITFKDNGTGRGDLTAIAHVRRTAAKDQHHKAVLAAKTSGDEPPAPKRHKAKIRSPGFKSQHRPLRGRNSLRTRP